MVNTTQYCQFQMDLKQLGFDGTCYADLVHVYILVRLLIAYSPAENDYFQALSDKRYTKVLETYKLRNFSINNDSYHDALARVCSFVVSEDYLTDYIRFFEDYAPGIVSNWNELRSVFPEKKSVGIMLLALLNILHTFSAEKICDITNTNISSVFRKHQTLWKSLSLNSESFSRCCKAIYITALEPLIHRNRPKIKKAIGIYRQLFIPLTQFVTDYSNILHHVDELELSINPWIELNRKVYHLPVESGISDLQAAFNRAAFRIKDELPHEVIQAAFYPQGRDDSMFECSYILDTFLQNLSSGSTLIINPSPDFIMKWCQSNATNVIMAVPDTTIAYLYGREFPSVIFIPFDQIADQNIKYDNVLIIARDTSPEKFYPVFSACSQTAKVMAFMPESALTLDNSIIKHMMPYHFSVERIIAVPTTVTNSIPRKKMLLFAQNAAPSEYFQLSFSYGNQQSFVIEKNCYPLQAHRLLENKTLIQLKDSYLIDHTVVFQKHPDEAKRYSFSEEIDLCYTLSDNRKGRYAAKAYYRARLRNTDKNRKRGDRLTDMVEKGLRAKSIDKVLGNMERVVFDERIYPYIVEDVKDYFAENIHTVSLKTIWFCCRSHLLEKSSYQEPLFFEMFCNDDQSLSNIHPYCAESETYIDALHGLFSDHDDHLMKYWRQLNFLFSIAKDEGFVQFNPVTDILKSVSNRADAETLEIRNALTKKVFTAQEEETLISFLGEDSYARCINNSLWLGSLMSFFTGIPIRELCGLKWSDFENIGGTDAYQITVSGYVDGKGALLEYSHPSEWVRCRKVPAAPLLSSVMNNRIAYLRKKYSFSDQELEDIYILWETEPDNKKGIPRKPCSRNAVRTKCRELLEVIDIPENKIQIPDPDRMIISDLNRYNGDIFYTNYKYRINHSCGFTRGERNYVLGIKAQDTFSQHYCDFSHDLLQYAMAEKMKRWCFTPQKNHSTCTKYDCSKFHKQTSNTIHSSPDTVPVCDVVLNSIEPDANMTFTITIESGHGYVGEICVYPREEV